jgi:putative transposase
VRRDRPSGQGPFLDRPIEGDWPYLWTDATYLKIHQVGCIVSVAAIVAVKRTAEITKEKSGLSPALPD